MVIITSFNIYFFKRLFKVKLVVFIQFVGKENQVFLVEKQQYANQRIQRCYYNDYPQKYFHFNISVITPLRPAAGGDNTFIVNLNEKQSLTLDMKLI